MKPSVLLLSEETLKDKTIVNNNVDSKYLQQAIWTVQEEQIHPLLGTTLYKRLLTGVKDKNLKDEEKELLDDYIANVMVFYCLSELPTILAYKFTNKNIVIQDSENAEAATMAQLAALSSKYKNKAEFFSERMKRFVLQKVAEDKLMEYCIHDGKADSLIPTKKSYSCSFVL